MQVVIIGAGIVGLHSANLLQEKGHDVFVLDSAPFLAEHTSGRNSGVIHSGVFYKTGSFKEKVCIEGNRLTYEWIEKLHVNYKPCGKWVVPEEGQENDLDPFFEKIRKLPMPPPQKFSKSELKEKEPSLRPSEAIFVPSTGIVDAAGYVKAMANFIEAKGGQVILNCQVKEIHENKLETSGGEIPFDLCVNSAGLFADEIAKVAGLEGYTIKPCRGDYYLLNKQPVSRPVYHLPYGGTHGLGVHLTPTLDGQTLLGPNAFFIEEKLDYKHHSSPEAYENAVRFYLPQLKDFKIDVAYSGNRPKLYRDNQAVGEFVTQKKGNWIHLLGIESPGLTSAPALAKELISLM
ncbi:MAG: NAD(P)/FAD-dependent oxidoreductase [Deltaproteobacteria bacterium]|nr:NAD(P)/FAD-dependent oxidoreductase [Deltaproteobacteria bacterium]